MERMCVYVSAAYGNHYKMGPYNSCVRLRCFHTNFYQIYFGRLLRYRPLPLLAVLLRLLFGFLSTVLLSHYVWSFRCFSVYLVRAQSQQNRIHWIRVEIVRAQRSVGSCKRGIQPSSSEIRLLKLFSECKTKMLALVKSFRRFFRYSNCTKWGTKVVFWFIIM